MNNFLKFADGFTGIMMERLQRKAFFIYPEITQNMDFKTRVEELIQAFLEERKDIYLVDLKISAGNDVVVILDGDESLSIQDCLYSSRAIEYNQDRE